MEVGYFIEGTDGFPISLISKSPPLTCQRAEADKKFQTTLHRESVSKRVLSYSIKTLYNF
jgi:hypothetical protein